MAGRFKVLVQSFIDDTLYEPGAEVSFDGEPGSNLEPLDDAAKEMVAIAKAKRDAKASAIVTGVGAQVNAEFAEALAAVAADVAKIKLALSGVDFAQIKTDISEHDVGLELLADRISAVEGVIETLAKAPAPAPSAVAPTESTTAPAPAASGPADPAPSPAA